MDYRVRLMILSGFALAMSGAARGADVSLPLEGHYRPGRFLPVRVTHAGPGEVRFSAPACVTTVIQDPGAGEVVAPFLAIVDSPTALQVTGAAPVELKPVGDGQRLVVTADADSRAALSVFPGDQLVTVPLDLNRPLLEPVLAWTGVDAVVVSPTARARLTDQQISVLLAGGVAVVVAGGQKPDARWPWVSLNDAWVLRHDVAGPRQPLRAEAYSPTYMWDRGVPGAVRRQVVLAAAVFAILGVGVSLWRRRIATVAFLGLCAGAGLIVVFAYMRGSRELTMQKTVVVTDSRLEQLDGWVWYACLRDSRMTGPAIDVSFPVFASQRQIEQCEPRLVCDGQGRPVSYDFQLDVNQALAFVTRSVWPVPEDVPAPAFHASGPVWNDFASDLYVGPGDRLEGEGKLTADLDATYVIRNVQPGT